MTARVTQQVLTVAYSTTPPVRITAIAVEVIRANSSTPITTKKGQVVVVSG